MRSETNLVVFYLELQLERFIEFSLFLLGSAKFAWLRKYNRYRQVGERTVFLTEKEWKTGGMRKVERKREKGREGGIGEKGGRRCRGSKMNPGDFLFNQRRFEPLA